MITDVSERRVGNILWFWFMLLLKMKLFITYLNLNRGTTEKLRIIFPFTEIERKVKGRTNKCIKLSLEYVGELKTLGFGHLNQMSSEVLITVSFCRNDGSLGHQ